MTLQNCTHPDWWADDAALPTTATLRLEWQRAEAEHAAIMAEGIDFETAGEPDEWALPPKTVECPACCAVFAYAENCPECGAAYDGVAK